MLTMKKLMEMQARIWNFRIDGDQATTDLVAREQIKSLGQSSRLGSLAAIPVVIYMMSHLFVHATPPFIAFGLFCVAVSSFIAVRNFIRHARFAAGKLRRNNVATLDIIRAESIINAISYSLIIALPLAFGQIPIALDVAFITMGALIIGGFVYGSIPRAQTYYLAITTTIFATGFVAAGGWQVVSSIVLLIFLTLNIDYIYRLFFYNFAQRHIKSAKLGESVETVRLLLNDYSEQSSDWLWEVDDQLRISNPSSRFAAAAAITTEELQGRPLIALFDESNERDALLQMLRSSGIFRNIDLPITINGARHWWRLSGRPVSSTGQQTVAIRGFATDITMSKLAEDRIAHLAHFDSLTDLPNRILFNQTLQRSIQRMRADQCLAVLCLDLDNFKLINDTLGHGAGDIVLKTVAHRLELAIGNENVASRLGGDEFAISLRNVNSVVEAERCAKAIVKAINEPIIIEGQPVATGISIGLSMAPEHGTDAETLMSHADIALYRAKKNCRGNVAIFNPGMAKTVQDRRDIELDLHAAVHSDQLELHYQPLVNIESREIVAYEALLRWHHPKKGNIPPDIFIPIAEESGLIVALGEWVLRTAINEVSLWPEHLSVSVNLSPVQMRSPNLIPTIINALASAEVDPARLELEITESVLMSDTASNVDLLHKIRSLGVRVALDDFGTGYSSLNYLRSFPFDKIKIDRCFVEDVVSRADCRAIIRAVTGLASSLGMVTTAEGVERDDQLRQLRTEGCEEVQGYLFAKAMPACEIVGRRQPDITSPSAVEVLPSSPPAADPITREGDGGAEQDRDVA